MIFDISTGAKKGNGHFWMKHCDFQGLLVCELGQVLRDISRIIFHEDKMWSWEENLEFVLCNVTGGSMSL